MTVDDIQRFFDRYSRVARLYPAVLAIAPFVWTVAVLRPGLIEDDAARGFISAILLLGGLYLLASIARWRGKTIEGKLLDGWGGWPTRILLRHRDRTIDRFTKAHYHAQIQALRDGLSLPSIEEEARDPIEADDRYRSATKRLIELRRDPAYRMLHSENASYGFRRNLLGLKPVGIVITLAMATLAAFLWWRGSALPANSAELLADVPSRWSLYVDFAADIIYLLVWIVVVRPKFVRQAANEYAQALFKTLE